MNTSPNVRMFAPEQWGEIDKFAQFYAKTHDFKPDAKKAVGGVRSHFKKAITLRELARKLAPNIAIDKAELQKNGYSGAIIHKSFQQSSKWFLRNCIPQ